MISLLSLFGGATVSLLNVQMLEPETRKYLAIVLLTAGQEGFTDYLIREIFKTKGDQDAHWFLACLTKKDFK